MLDKFNFYDIYGYVVPGLVLLGLLVVPDAVASGTAPSPDLGTALLYILAAYVIGHLLLQISSAPFPHVALAHVLLDDSDKTLSSSVKIKIRAAIKSRFGLDMDFSPPPREAFDLCRAALVQGNAAQTLTQFQSLYVALRHLATACVLGACFTLGWIVRPSNARSGGELAICALLGLLWVAFALTCVFGIAHPKELWARCKKGWLLTVASVVLAAYGFLESGSSWKSVEVQVTLVFSSMTLIGVHKLLLLGYQKQSQGYSRELWLAFLAMETKNTTPKAT